VCTPFINFGPSDRFITELLNNIRKVGGQVLSRMSCSQLDSPFIIGLIELWTFLVVSVKNLISVLEPL
jgi:hypothetical protein